MSRKSSRRQAASRVETQPIFHGQPNTHATFGCPIDESFQTPPFERWPPIQPHTCSIREQSCRTARTDSKLNDRRFEVENEIRIDDDSVTDNGKRAGNLYSAEAHSFNEESFLLPRASSPVFAGKTGLTLKQASSCLQFSSSAGALSCDIERFRDLN